METKSQNMLKPALIYTAIVFGLGVLHTVITDVAGFAVTNMKVNGIIGLVIMYGAVIYSMYGYRKEYCGNTISYGKALGFGVLVTAMAALLGSLLSFYYVKYVSPELGEAARILQEEAYIRRGFSADRIEQATRQAERFNTVFFSAFFGTIYLTFIGLIVSLIAAIFIKKGPKDPFEGVE